MHLDTIKSGFIISCDKDFIIQEVLQDHSGYNLSRYINTPLITMLDSGSINKAVIFQEDLRKSNNAVSWELNLSDGESLKPFYFAGLNKNDSFYIIGSANSDTILEIVTEIMTIENEQTNRLRELIKENINLKLAVSDSGELYNEISKLNNELVDLHRELSRQKAGLEELVKQKNRFLGIAAHDLRNPLANICHLTQTMLEENLDKNKSLEYLEYIKSLSNFMLHLISELLDFSEVENGTILLKSAANDITECIKQTIRLSEIDAAKKDIVIRLTIPEKYTSILIEFDTEKISQVMTNLLSNAIKYSPASSEIELKLEFDEKYCSVYFLDRGPGISNSDLGELFKPFSRSCNRPTGGERSTGLGLFISKKIIEAHSGKIGVYKNIGGGSVFYFQIPVKGSGTLLNL